MSNDSYGIIKGAIIIYGRVIGGGEDLVGGLNEM